jgi:cytochrome b-561 domain-containing protein 2
MTQAIILFSDNFFSNRLTHPKKISFHWILQTFAVSLIAIAFIAIYVNKERNAKPHFQSYHGLLGVTTVAISLVAVLGGTFTKYSYQLKNYLKPVYAKIIHSSLGCLNWLLAIATILLGVYSTWFESSSSRLIQLIITILLLISTPIILSKSFVSLKNRINNEFRKSRT